MTRLRSRRGRPSPTPRLRRRPGGAGRYRIEAPEAVRRRLEEAREETPKPGDPRLARVENVMIATPRVARGGGRRREAAGVTPLLLGDALEVRRPRSARSWLGSPARWPCTTILCRPRASCFPAGRRPSPCGARAVAGAMSSFCSPWWWRWRACRRMGDRWRHGRDRRCRRSGRRDRHARYLARATALGMEPRANLADNDGHGFFQALGDQLITGPTLTNVNDFRAILVMPTISAPTFSRT